MLGTLASTFISMILKHLSSNERFLSLVCAARTEPAKLGALCTRTHGTDQRKSDLEMVSCFSTGAWHKRSTSMLWAGDRGAGLN